MRSRDTLPTGSQAMCGGVQGLRAFRYSGIPKSLYRLRLLILYEYTVHAVYSVLLLWYFYGSTWYFYGSRILYGIMCSIFTYMFIWTHGVMMSV